MDTAELRALFPGLETRTYLNTAGMGLGSLPARQAYEHALSQWADGDGNLVSAQADRAAEESRRLFAAIVGADADEVALVPFASAAAGVVAAQFPEARTGDNVLVGDIEFSSNYFAWRLLEHKGYEVRLVPSVEGMLPPEAYAARADAGTRLIAASAVQSASGYRMDLADLSEVARRSDAWLFVDGAQAVGAVDVDVRRDEIDFLAVPSHKYLLASRGMGYLYVRRGLIGQLQPVLAGWRAGRIPGQSFYGPTMELSETASKLDTSQVWFSACAEPHTLGILHQFGLSEVVQRNLQLTAYLYESLLKRGLSPWPFPIANRSPIVSIPVEEPEATMDRLQAAKVVASLRAGRIRLSLHFYNTESEIDRAVALLAEG